MLLNLFVLNTTTAELYQKWGYDAVRFPHIIRLRSVVKEFLEGEKDVPGRPRAGGIFTRSG